MEKNLNQQSCQQNKEEKMKAFKYVFRYFEDARKAGFNGHAYFDEELRGVVLHNESTNEYALVV